MPRPASCLTTPTIFSGLPGCRAGRYGHSVCRWGFRGGKEGRGFVDVVQAHGVLAVGGIQFHDNLVGQAADSRSDTAGCRQVDFTVGSNLACLDDGNITFP